LAAELGIRARVTRYALGDADHALADLREGRVEGSAVLEVAGAEEESGGG
jgi:hypothetical protein